MSEASQLKASVRERVGKGAARAIRREGKIPAVIYGDNKAPVTISLDYAEVLKELNAGHFLSTVYEIEIDGKASPVLARDCQVDPIKDLPVHVDFLRVGKGTVVSVQVPVTFINEESSPGLEEGGVLNVVRHELDLTCSPAKIPDEIEIDVGEMNIGDSLHISEVTLPEGVTSTITDRDFTIVTIAAATIIEEPEEDEDEDAEEGEDAEGEDGETEGEGEDGEEGDDK